MPAPCFFLLGKKGVSRPVRAQTMCRDLLDSEKGDGVATEFCQAIKERGGEPIAWHSPTEFLESIKSARFSAAVKREFSYPVKRDVARYEPGVWQTEQ